MTFEEFKKLFNDAIEEASLNAENKLGRLIPRSFLFQYHGPGRESNKRDFTFEEVLNRIFLSEEKFFRIIDVAVIAVTPTSSVVFVRVSGHEPSTLDKTFYGNSPFKQLIAQPIRVYS